YGHAVRVFEKSGWLYGRARGREVALKWPDDEAHREQAQGWAKDQADRLAVGLASAVDPVPTTARVFALYLSRETDRKARSSRAQDRRAAKLFTTFLGADRSLEKLTLDEWTRF